MNGIVVGLVILLSVRVIEPITQMTSVRPLFVLRQFVTYILVRVVRHEVLGFWTD